MWIFSANILVSNTPSMVPPIPLDVNDGLPGIDLWFGNNEQDEVGFICHMDTCAAINTGNLTVHQWLMMSYPHLVAEYITFDDHWPFKPLQLHCAVDDLVQTESMHRKLTAIFNYWLCYKQDGK